MMFRLFCNVIVLALAIQASLLNTGDKLIALNSGGEHIFNCYGEIKIHQGDCVYGMEGQKITVDTGKRCDMRFTCNATVFTALCCFEKQHSTMEKTYQMVARSKNEIEDDFKEIGKSNTTVFTTKFEDSFIKIKLDGTVKLLLLLLILLLLIILTSIVFCKIWCMRRMLSLEPKSYAVFDDNVKKDKAMKGVASIDVKKMDNLINLNQEDQEINRTKEEIDIVNFPLQV